MTELAFLCIYFVLNVPLYSPVKYINLTHYFPFWKDPFTLLLWFIIIIPGINYFLILVFFLPLFLCNIVNQWQSWMYMIHKRVHIYVIAIYEIFFQNRNHKFTEPYRKLFMFIVLLQTVKEWWSLLYYIFIKIIFNCNIKICTNQEIIWYNIINIVQCFD